MDLNPANSEKRQFHIRSCLGRGGFGEVYRATMMSAGGVRSDVAVKVLLQEVDPRSQAVERLRDEARLLGVLNHPNILKVTDLVLLDQRVALVTEYVEGADLDYCIAPPEDPIPLRALVETIGRVGDALHAAHTSTGADGAPLHLVHRDIKPSNIRISRHGSVKLLDFGIAKAADARREAKTQTNALIGSFLYMAPERFDDVDVTPAADVYALGLTLYEGIHGTAAFGDLTVKHQYGLAFDADRHDEAIEQRLAKIDPPAGVMALLRRMLAYRPEDRPTPTELSTLCDDLADELEGASLRRWSKTHPWPQPQAIDGPLDGKVITETAFTVTRNIDSLAGTPAPETRWVGPDTPTGAAPARRPDTASATASTQANSASVRSEPTTPRMDTSASEKKSGRGMVWVGLALVGLLVGGAVVLGGLVLASQTLTGTSVEVEPTPELKTKQTPPAPPSAPEPTVVPEPAVAPQPVVATEPEPVPTAPTPKAPAAPKVTTAPQPKPAPTETQPASGSKTAQVLVTGANATLRNGNGEYAPGEVPAGTYELWADFGKGPVREAVVKAVAGQSITYQCSRLRQECTAR